MEDKVVSNDEETNDKIITDNDDSLASEIDPHPKNILEIEGVDRMENETEEKEIEGVDSET